MLDFDTIDYLKNGTEKQQRVYEILTRQNILSSLAAFSPILTGTIPIGIDIDTSDLDVCCHWKNKTGFIQKVASNFKNEKGFVIREVTIDNLETVIANFEMGGLEIEIFGQDRPVKDQNAYRHMLVEYEILQQKGEHFRQEVIRLKQNGYKTEPAFGLLLGLEHPYEELLHYKPKE